MELRVKKENLAFLANQVHLETMETKEIQDLMDQMVNTIDYETRQFVIDFI